MVYYKIKLTEMHFTKVTFLTLTRIFSSFSPSVGDPGLGDCLLVTSAGGSGAGNFFCHQGVRNTNQDALLHFPRTATKVLCSFITEFFYPNL